MKRLAMYLRTYRRLLLQLLLVFSAFAVMVVMSNYFASSIVERHISNYGDEVISTSAETIKAYLHSHEITLNDLAFVIEELRGQGGGVDATQAELIKWSGWLYEKDERFDNLLFIYAVVDDSLILGTHWDYPDDFDPASRVWYTGAGERNGGIYYSDPYSDANTGEFITTISRQVIGPDGEPFGVVALDVSISSIAGYIRNLQLMNSGYAVMLDSNRRIIFHPVADVLGLRIEDVAGGSGYREIAALLDAGEDISAFNYSAIQGENDVAFFKKLFNGWYLELSLSSKVYHRDVDRMRASLSVTGSILALLVCGVLTFMHIARVRSEEANKTKSSFLAKMSHEIRTPMNAVIGMTELLLHEPLSERQAGYVNDINISARSLLSIINDILDLSKIESGKLTLEPVNYDFRVLIDNINSMFRYVAQERGVEFRFESDGEIPEILFGDEVRLRQVLTNLCGNAVKYTEEGYVRLKLSAAGNMLMFEIKDTGIGIAKDDMPKLFNAFVQVRSDRSRSIVGTGLGLTISKSFVEMMGGRIMIDSEFGQGTIVTVMLPMTPGRKSDVRNANAKVSELTLYAPSAKVLLVDDNDFNLKVAHELMMLFGIDARMADSGRKAVELAGSNDYDLIFMDHMMPDTDGIEATGEIRKLGGKHKILPIIALTANAVHGAKEMFLANGFSDYLSKPIDLQELSATLTKWLPKDVVSHRKEAAETESGAGAQIDMWDVISGVGAINTEIGLSRVSGMKGMYIDNMKSFHRKLLQESDRMSASLSGGDVADFSISVHAMKSSLATIGAMGLSDAALKLEMASKNGDIDFCNEHFPDFNAQLRSMHKALSALTAQRSSAERSSAEQSGGAQRAPGDRPSQDETPGDMDLLLRQVRIALAAAEDFDNDTGAEAINSVLQWNFGKEKGALLQSASDAFQAYDYDAAGDVLRKLTLLLPPP